MFVCVLSPFVSLKSAEATGIPFTLTNPSFEDPQSGSTIPGWTKIGQGSYTISTAPINNLGKSLLLTDNSTTDSIGMESDKVLGIVPGASYTASANMYVSSGTASIYIQFYDIAGNFIVNTSQWAPPPVQNWTIVSVTATAPANASKASVLLYSSTSGITSTYYDNIALGQTLRNPGFEEGNVGNVIPTGWSQPYGSTGISVVSDRFDEGTKSLKLVDTNPSGPIGVESDRMTVSAGKQIEVSARVYVESGVVSLYLRFWGANNAILNSKTHDIYENDEWTSINISDIAPAGTSKVGIILYSGGAGTGTAYFDAITLSAGPVPVITDLGVQITNITASYAAFGQDSAGNDLLYVGSNGSPSRLSLFNARTGNFINSFVLPGASAVWGMAVATDNSLYLGTESGKLFRYVPGATSVTDLGVLIEGETTIWELTAGTDGEIYGGTYPGGKAFKYKFGVGVTPLGGQIELGEQYVRSIAFDGANQLYMGIGAHAHLIRYDINSGGKTNILPSSYDSKEFVYYTNYVNGKIFARVTEPYNATLVIDKVTPSQIDQTLMDLSSIGVSKSSPVDNKVYYTRGWSLFSYDLTTKLESSQALMDVGGKMIGSTFLALNEQEYPGYSLVAALEQNKILKYNLQTGYSEIINIEVPEVSTEIRSIERGPDGNIYSIGFLQGGMGVYNTKTGGQTEYKGVGQAEDIATACNSMYFGIYPKAIIQQYDTTNPWSPSGSPPNPNPLPSLNAPNQDRPFAILPVPALNKLFVGTVPGYGKLGGALTSYDLVTGNWITPPQQFSNLSVISLAYKNNKLFIGTSVWGGLGKTPEATEAKLFVRDTTTNQTTEFPVGGKRAITDLIVGPDNKIWGLAEGTLFKFDLSSSTITYTQDLFPVSYSSVTWNIWRDAKMVVNPDGFVYATIGGKMYRINPNDMSTKTLVSSGAYLLTQDFEGDLYYMSGVNMYKYDK